MRKALLKEGEQKITLKQEKKAVVFFSKYDTRDALGAIKRLRKNGYRTTTVPVSGEFEIIITLSAGAKLRITDLKTLKRFCDIEKKFLTLRADLNRNYAHN